MKKTVQIVTIPLDRQGWSKNDIVMMNGDIQFPLHTMESNIDEWQAQQLLVLSDDKLKKGDVILSNGNVCDLLHNGETPQDEDDPVKIVASYPQIEGTLPISKQTIQAWIDAGTPGESVLEMHQYRYVCGPNDHSAYELHKDAQGNLLLSFSAAVTDQDISNAAKKLGQTVEDIRSGYLNVEWIKPAIPTDEEIEKKSFNYVKGKYIPLDKAYGTKEEMGSVKTGYIHGYKQALKDLGHE